MHKIVTAALSFGIVCACAQASLTDSEPNDTIATASAHGPLVGADAGVGALGLADVDFYSFDLVAGTMFTASIFDFTPADPFDHDSLIALFASDGEQLLVDDDGGPGYLSSFAYIITESGTYYLGITGYGDDGFIGAHEENFSYKLVVNTTPVPGPSALAALAGALMLGRMRRRRAA